MGSEAPDPEAVLASISWRAEGPVVPVTTGWDNLIWRFETADGRVHALRLMRAGGGRTPEGMARSADREAAALAAAAAAGLPVPTNEARGTCDGAPFVVQPWLPGDPLFDQLRPRPWRTWQLGRALGRMQARIHAADPGESAVLPEAEAFRGIRPGELCEALRATARFDTLCHLDYHPLNVLCVGTRITGVVDFTNAAVADRRADLGRTESLLLDAPLPPDVPRPLRPVLALVRRVLWLAWRSGYRAEAGDFPLEPAFRALGVSMNLREVARAAREGRGWATDADVAKLRNVLRRRLRAAGIRPSRG